MAFKAWDFSLMSTRAKPEHLIEDESLTFKISADTASLTLQQFCDRLKTVLYSRSYA